MKLLNSTSSDTPQLAAGEFHCSGKGALSLFLSLRLSLYAPAVVNYNLPHIQLTSARV